MKQDNSMDKVEVRKIYYESGALCWETPYVNGKKHGIVRSYYASGALLWETPYVNGKKHGIEKCYYESGALRLETPYVNEDMHGIVKEYEDDNSNICRLTLCKDGIEELTLRCVS